MMDNEMIHRLGIHHLYYTLCTFHFNNANDLRVRHSPYATIKVVHTEELISIFCLLEESFIDQQVRVGLIQGNPAIRLDFNLE